ncbi:MAG: FHA domain-containing protein, partial [Planctomycetes bacterium]|nr:FHA domain-containing protein [Planctomycetota bacterium]
LQPNREFCIIGRRKGCDISLSEKRVSRVHALLVTYHGHPALVDLISTHQTLVNDEPIAFRVLKDEDMVTIGESQFRIRVVGSAVGRTASTDGKSAGTPEIVAPPDVASPGDRDDHVDIGTVEGARRWTIAEKAQKTARKQGS